MPVASAITRVFSWRAAVAAIAAVTGVVPIVATTGHSAAQDSGPRAAVANGRALVERSKCLDCHRIGDRGSRLGPTLTDIGNLRSREELRDALVAPDQDVLPEHRSVRLVTKDGATIVGRLLNQDAFSIQLMNADEQLKSYARSSLREHTIVTKGLMPSYEGKLTSQEIADVVNYLASLPEGEDLDAAPNPTPALDRVLHAEREPQNWLTYGGSYSSQRYSLLDQIKPENVGRLTLKWVWRPEYLDKMETTPLVVDGVLYAVQNSEVVALDAATGRSFWTFRYRVPPESNAYLMVVKGLAISGDRLFWATYDGHLIAIDAKTGKSIWNRTLVDWKKGLQFNVAPLVVKDKVILGPATNEYGVNCWIAAFDVRTGKQVWKFNTVAEPGEPGNDTWPGDSWQHGGSPIWVTGSYDPATNLTFWGTGNPNPGWTGGPRNPGDNLYSDSVVALDADTGKLKWHYQFTPNDEFDWDSVQVPVLADITWQGQPRKAMLWGNRNGFFYVLDRVTGQFLMGKAFVKQNWNEGFDAKGRPIRAANAKPTVEGTLHRAWNAGRHELVLAVVQPAHGIVLPVGVGQLLGHLQEGRRSALGSREEVHRQDERSKRRQAWRRRRTARRDVPHGGGGLRRGPRDRSEDRREEVGLQDGRLHRERNPDDRLGPALLGRSRGPLRGARCADR